MRFSVNERNLILNYHAGSRIETIYELFNALPYMDASERNQAEDIIDKLEAISDKEFNRLVQEVESHYEY